MRCVLQCSYRAVLFLGQWTHGDGHCRALPHHASFFVRQLTRRGIPLHRVWLQQDGASAHTTAGVLSYLTETVGAHVVSRHGPQAWLPCSPDLTYPNFFLWGWVKSQAYQTLPRSLPQLKCKLRHAVSIPPSMLEVLADALPARARLCLRKHGAEIEHLPRR